VKQAKVSELKNNLSRYLSYVRRGGTVRVYDRDRPVAELVPIGRVYETGSPELDAVLADLERKGVVRRGSGALPADFLTRPLPRARRSVVEALLDERRDGRGDSGTVPPSYHSSSRNPPAPQCALCSVKTARWWHGD
jgi:antitoxin (DNA-binding transcriptional repressor) of toxin-antitoxin stability system